MKIAIYISGHGFGHLAQIAPVIKQLRMHRPDCRFLLRSALPRGELNRRLQIDFEFDAEAVDVGVVQISAIEEDREASIAALYDWLSTFEGRVDRDIKRLKQFSPDVVISNISPLAFPVARALKVPAVALATLDWFTIYAHWLQRDDPALLVLKSAYEQCDLLLNPPMAMDMSPFPIRQRIPLIADHPSDLDFVIRSGFRHTALVLFGGAGQPPFDLQALALMPDWLFLIPDAPMDAPDNVQCIDFSDGRKGADYMPLVDVVLCKPGYGTLAECWVSGTPIAWVERPEFPEFPMLKQWLEATFPAAGMSRPQFQRGAWLPALEGAIHSQRIYPSCDDGAAVAAQAILATLHSKVE